MTWLLRTGILCFAVLGSAFAQTVGASLQGTVTDPSGAAIANATVQIANLGTGAIRTLSSDAAGHWREPVLLPGDYEVRISATGFQTSVRQGIHLDVGQDATLDMRLEVGVSTSEIRVYAQATTVNLVSGALSGLVDQKQMRDLPLNGRS